MLYTKARNKAFSVQVEGETLWFVPTSSGKRRRANPEKTERVLSLLGKIGSPSSGSYKEITFNASYIIAVANQYVKTAA
jgi:hypothetical protein